MADHLTPLPDQPHPAPADRRALTSAANGRRSRGPVTPEGKAASRFNALKHGIHARQLRITRGPATEDAAELAAMVKRVLARVNSQAQDDGTAPLRPPPRHPDPAPAHPAPPTFNPDIIDRVTRYEGPLEKAFYRALRELLDLQARRRARATRHPDATPE